MTCREPSLGAGPEFPGPASGQLLLRMTLSNLRAVGQHRSPGPFALAGTLLFPLALSDPEDDQKVTGLSLLRGAQPFNNFKTELDKVLTGDAPAPAK